MLNIAVMGAGLIGARHSQIVQDSTRARLAAIIEPNLQIETPAQIPRFMSLHDVSSPLDGVIIATPTSLHLAHIKECAERGSHVLVEKPVTATLEDAIKADEISKKAGIHCLVGHHRRYHKKLHMLREMVQTGAIGDVITSSMIWAVKKPDYYFQNNWRSREGSPVLINLIHDVDMLRFVMGEVIDIVGFGSGNIRGAGRVESGAVALRFANNATATISFADTASSPWGFEMGMGENPNIGTTHQDMWWITGTKGAVSFPSLTLWNGSTNWATAPKPTRLECANTIALHEQLEHFLDVITSDAIPIISAVDAGKSLETTIKIHKHLNGTI